MAGNTNTIFKVDKKTLDLMVTCDDTFVQLESKERNTFSICKSKPVNLCWDWTKKMLHDFPKMQDYSQEFVYSVPKIKKIQVTVNSLQEHKLLAQSNREVYFTSYGKKMIGPKSKKKEYGVDVFQKKSCQSSDTSEYPKKVCQLVQSKSKKKLKMRFQTWREHINFERRLKRGKKDWKKDKRTFFLDHSCNQNEDFTYDDILRVKHVAFPIRTRIENKVKKFRRLIRDFDEDYQVALFKLSTFDATGFTPLNANSKKRTLCKELGKKIKSLSYQTRRLLGEIRLMKRNESNEVRQRISSLEWWTYKKYLCNLISFVKLLRKYNVSKRRGKYRGPMRSSFDHVEARLILEENFNGVLGVPTGMKSANCSVQLYNFFCPKLRRMRGNFKEIEDRHDENFSDFISIMSTPEDTETGRDLIMDFDLSLCNAAALQELTAQYRITQDENECNFLVEFVPLGERKKNFEISRANFY